MKYIELFRRGYLLLDLDRTRAQGKWYYPATLRTCNLTESFGGAVYSEAGNAHLVPALAPAPARTQAPDPAP